MEASGRPFNVFSLADDDVHVSRVTFVCVTVAGEMWILPEGFMNSPIVVTVNKESGQTADTIVWQNLVKMYARMLPSSLGRAVWIANIDIFPELATMAIPVGIGGGPTYQLSNGSSASILGRPLVFTKKMETLGDLGDIAFVDFGYYQSGDHQSMQPSNKSTHPLSPIVKLQVRE